MGGNKLIFSLVFLLCAINVSIADIALAKEFLVNDAGDNAVCETICTLRGAIEKANANGESDVIHIDSSVSKIDIKKELALIGNDSLDDKADITIIGSAIIDAKKSGRVFSIAKNTHAVLNGLEITGGYANVSSSTPWQGGGIYNQGILRLSGVKIYGNSIRYDGIKTNITIRGAGIYNGLYGSLYISKSDIGPGNELEINGDKAEAQGAGIYNNNKLAITDSTIFKNSSLARSSGFKGHANARGGALYSVSPIPVFISDSTLYGNSVETKIENVPSHGNAQGAGIYLHSTSKSSASTLFMRNSTISGNQALSQGYAISGNIPIANGGAIFSGAYSKVNLANMTVADNSVFVPTSSFSGGTAFGNSFFVVSVPTITFRMKNSIVKGVGEQCAYPVQSNGYNVMSDASCVIAAGIGDKINTDPLLLPLGSNGGKTKTHKLSSESPAIDAGNYYGCYDFEDKLLNADQRGFFRPKQRCDSGAFEL